MRADRRDQAGFSQAGNWRLRHNGDCDILFAHDLFRKPASTFGIMRD
jgi:hypothetical protein